MSRYAIIRNGKIENIIEWDGDAPYDPGDGVTLRQLSDEEQASIGDAADPEVIP